MSTIDRTRITLNSGETVEITVVNSEDTICKECGKVANTRPYGPKGTDICYPCAKATPAMRELVEHNMGIVTFGQEGELR